MDLTYLQPLNFGPPDENTCHRPRQRSIRFAPCGVIAFRLKR